MDRALSGDSMRVDLKDLKNLLAEIAPGRFWGGLGRRATPVTPLLFFCAFTALAAISLGVFSKNAFLGELAFGLFAAVVAVSVATYLVCLIWSPDKLRSESYLLDVLRMEQSEASGKSDIPTGESAADEPAEAR